VGVALGKSDAQDLLDKYNFVMKEFPKGGTVRVECS
jgi:hypothetical protein